MSELTTLEINSDEWFADNISITKDQVVSVAFNEKAKTTEVTVETGQTVIFNQLFEDTLGNDNKVVPVKGTAAEVKAKLGM